MEYQLINPTLKINKKLTPFEQVFLNRGIHPDDITHYLNTTNEDIIPPKQITNILSGAQTLIKHISNGDKIFMQIDSDCDGFTSAAVLMNYLYKLFPEYMQNNFTYRLHTGKQHGIVLETIPEDTKLVIVPDAGSNNFEEHKILRERGVDVLVIDHHEAERISENAIIINNQLCDYPTKSLSGVGMVYKFCSFFDQMLNINYADNYLDLVALGLVADMMDLRDYETRHLITLGLQDIQNPFFKTMVEKNTFSIGDIVTPIGVAFYVAPYVNATIRMGSQEEKELMFLAMLDFKANDMIPSTKRGARGSLETVVEQACRNCTNIKNRQTKARDNALETIEELIQEQNLLDNKLLIIQLDENHIIDKNITGLIANQLMAKYQRPVLLLNMSVDEETGKVLWSGSGRGYDKSRFDDFRGFLLKSDLMQLCEGHANAFGAAILDSQIEKLVEYSNLQLSDFDFTPCYKVDFIFSAFDFRGNDIIEIAQLKKYWGQNFDEVKIAIEQIKVHKDNIVLMSKDRNPTLKITLPNGTSLIKFKSSEEEFNSLYSEQGYIEITVVGKCEMNIWNGSITPQVIIEDYEITGSQQYLF